MSDGYTSPIIGALGTLIRDNIRSRNYVAGVSGWAIFANGFAEFLDLVIRGSFSTGSTGQRVEIRDDLGIARVLLWSGDADEVAPMFVAATPQDIGPPYGFVSVGTIMSNEDGAGRVTILLYAPQAGASGVIALTTDGAQPAAFLLDTSMAMRMQRADPVTLAGFTHAWGLGVSASNNLAADPFGFQARNNGVAAPLALNTLGGGVTTPDMRYTGASDAGPLSTASTAYVSLGSTANLTMPYPPSGVIAFTVAGVLSSNLAAGRSLLGFEIRDTNAAGTLRVGGTVARSASSQGTDLVCSSRTVTIGGLPTTGTMFARAMFRSSTTPGNTASFEDVRIDVAPSP